MKYSPKPTPGGISRILYRAPLWLYRLGLGGLLGKRFIRLFHRGRKSGLVRETVVEVIRYDPETCEAVVISAWGDRADWVRNMRQTPGIEAQIGWSRYRALAVFLNVGQRIEEFMQYARRYPKMAVRLPGLVGYELDGSEDDFRAFAVAIEMVVVKPV